MLGKINYQQLADNERLTDLMFAGLLDAWVKRIKQKLMAWNSSFDALWTGIQYFDQDLNHLL